MARAVGGEVLLAMLLVLGLLHNAAATVYRVGSDSGWTFVMSGQTSYDDQFKNIDLVIGDTLAFDFITGDHSVLEVPAADVSACNTGAATQTFASPVNVTLATAGSHGFMCGFPSHCSSFGMHLLVTVNAAAGPVASPTISPAPSPAASPEPAMVSGLDCMPQGAAPESSSSSAAPHRHLHRNN